MRKNIEIISPARIKEFEGKLGISPFNAEISKRELYDTGKWAIIDIKKKGECALFVNEKGEISELCRTEEGHYSIKRVVEPLFRFTKS